MDDREHRIRAAAAALCAAGRPIEEIKSLRDLVDPLENAEAIVQFHYRRRKHRELSERYETRPSGLIGITETLRQIAKLPLRPTGRPCRGARQLEGDGDPA